MRRMLSIGGAVCAAVIAVGSATAVIGDPQLVSLDDAGDDRTGVALAGAVSADGRWVAFTSTDDLTGTPTNGVAQLYVRDTSTGHTTLASASVLGDPAGAPVDDPSDRRAYAISGDGRYVVFTSEAFNLVAGEQDGTDRDVFRKDLRTGAITIVSRSVAGGAADAPVAGDPDVSFDGSRVVYETGLATNLWAGDLSSASDIVVRDLVAGSQLLASVGVAATPLTGVIRRPTISADGQVVAFEDDGAVTIRQLGSNTTSVLPAVSTFPDLSGDGRVVVFQDGAGQIVRRDRVTGTSTVVSAGATPGVTADGSRVVFETDAVLPGDGNGVRDVAVRGLTEPSERVSERGSGEEVARPADRPAISADGAFVAFGMDDGGAGQTLNPLDIDGAPDVLVARLAPSDITGPAIALQSPSAGTVVAAATLVVAGTVSDISGVVGVTVNGYPATLGPANTLSVEVPLAVGAGLVTVRAVDGAGRASERAVTVTRTAPGSGAPAAKARARSLRIVRVGTSTRARFSLDVGATRVGVRLWRRVDRVGQSPTWTPATSFKLIATRAGSRTAIMSRRRLRPGVYQARVTVVSRGGVAVTVVRHVVTQSPRPR